MDPMNTSEQLIQAVKEGDANQVAALLRADLGLARTRTTEGLSVVLLATYYGHAAIAQQLANAGQPLDIFEASAIGKAGRVAELIQTDPGLVNAFSGDGFQPLGLAAFFGHADVVDALLRAGAHVNVASSNPMRVMPLHSAVANRNVAIARVLVEHGADVNATQQDDFTPLMEAAQNGDLETARLLLDHGADPAVTKTGGLTALMMAAEAGHTAMVELLQEPRVR